MLTAIRFSLIFSLLLTHAVSLAQEQSPLISKMKAFNIKIDAQTGKEIVTPATEALPGEIIEYRLYYQNNSSKDISGLIITGPIPNSTQYQEKSARTELASEFWVSIDNGVSWNQEPVKQTKTKSDGQVIEIIVPETQYTQLRWKVNQPLKPKEIQEYRYRVKVK